MIDDPRAPRLIGLNELSLAFNDVVSAATMTEVAHGAPIDRSGPAPGRTVISYAYMTDEEPPGMSRAYLDETLAVASTLRVPTGGAQDTARWTSGARWAPSSCRPWR